MGQPTYGREIRESLDTLRCDLGGHIIRLDSIDSRLMQSLQYQDRLIDKQDKLLDSFEGSAELMKLQMQLVFILTIAFIFITLAVSEWFDNPISPILMLLGLLLLLFSIARYFIHTIIKK